jgi:hypothetical protein
MPIAHISRLIGPELDRGVRAKAPTPPPLFYILWGGGVAQASGSNPGSLRREILDLVIVGAAQTLILSRLP